MQNSQDCNPVSSSKNVPSARVQFRKLIIEKKFIGKHSVPYVINACKFVCLAIELAISHLASNLLKLSNTVFYISQLLQTVLKLP